MKSHGRIFSKFSNALGRPKPLSINLFLKVKNPDSEMKKSSLFYISRLLWKFLSSIFFMTIRHSVGFDIC
jgi:hypothetical protein